MPYCFGTRNEQFVEAWTTWHLNFPGHATNTPEDDAYRKELCDRIRGLRACGSLRAMYTCLQLPRGRDLENTLFYNVGPAVFGQRRFLRFERKVAAPPSPPTLLPNSVAYVRYEIGKQTAPNGPTLAECEPVDCQKDDLKDPARLWRLFKQNVKRADGVVWERGTAFNAEVVVWAPDDLNLADRAKKVLDGFLSALHHRSQMDSDLDEVVTRIKTRYQWDRDEVRALLLQNANAVLGHCRVPRPHIRNDPRSLMWSPNDHLLAGCEIVHETSPNGRWKIKGRLFL